MRPMRVASLQRPGRALAASSKFPPSLSFASVVLSRPWGPIRMRLHRSRLSLRPAQRPSLGSLTLRPTTNYSAMALNLKQTMMKKMIDDGRATSSGTHSGMPLQPPQGVQAAADAETIPSSENEEPPTLTLREPPEGEGHLQALQAAVPWPWTAKRNWQLRRGDSPDPSGPPAAGDPALGGGAGQEVAAKPAPTAPPSREGDRAP
eukprot:4915397-Pyramimonas_sp.AAC.1